DLQQLLGASNGVLGELHQIDRVREGEQVTAISPQRRRNDLAGVRAVGVENVVAPVGVQNRTMRLAVLPIRRLPVTGAEHREKIGKKIDQHGGQYESGEEE